MSQVNGRFCLILVLFYSRRDKILWLIRVSAYKNQLMFPYIFNGSVGYSHGKVAVLKAKKWKRILITHS